MVIGGADLDGAGSWVARPFGRSTVCRLRNQNVNTGLTLSSLPDIKTETDPASGAETERHMSSAGQH